MNSSALNRHVAHAFAASLALSLIVLSTADRFWIGSTATARAAAPAAADGREPGLIGHWKLRGDCRDWSGNGNHGVNHGVSLDEGTFDGIGAYIEVPSHPSLKLGTRDFTICARVHTAEEVNDILGDVLDLYDAELRRGITLSLQSSAGGYQSQGTDRHLFFGIDNARVSDWKDCGRPNPTSNYVSNSLTAFQGKLYAATIDAQDEGDRRRVYRYDGGDRWIDCGQVGTEQTTGVMPLIVHDGKLFAVTSTYDWTRVREGAYAPGRVFEYAGGTHWLDRGRPSDNRTLNCAASYKGKLFVGGGPQAWGVYALDRQGQWETSKLFPMSGPQKCFPHTMCCFNGKLYVGWPSVYAFDGDEWTYAGVPSDPESTLQTHSLTAYRGQLCAGTWPLAKVSRYLGGEKWEVFGRVGEDGTEVNALVVYNGKLYGGSIPRAEVCRYDGEEQWTSLKRFYSPDGWTPVPPADNGGRPTRQQVAEWSRVTSLTIHDGRLFASIGSCTSSVLDAPADVRGRVFSMEAGKCASTENDIGPGWKHLAAIRQGGLLKLFVDGKLVATSTAFESADYDLSTDRPLRIGFGQTDYFAGKIADVRLYNRALSDVEVTRQSALRDTAGGPPRDVSPEGVAYLEKLRKNTPFGTNSFDLAGLRGGMGTRRPPADKDVRLVPTKVGNVPCEWVLAPGADPDVRLLYLHGGGFVSGSGGFYLTMAAHVSRATQCAVLLPDYRLAPEHPFPAGLDDCVAAHDWMRSNGPSGPGAAKATFVAGDSAGGNLTLATVLALRDRGLPLPAGAIPISSTTDLTLESDSLQTVFDPIISSKTMPVFREMYLGKADPRNPLASPVFGDYRGLPPLLIVAGEHEMLLDDNLRVAEKAKADGASVTLEIWPGMFHVFQSHEPLLPEARESLERMGEFVKGCLELH